MQSCAHFGSKYHLVNSSSLRRNGLEGTGPTVLGQLPTQTETTKGFSIFGILTQHNPTRESCCFTESQTQHANIRPRKALALTSTPSTHFCMTHLHFQSSSREIRGERPLRARQPVGSLLSEQHEGPVLPGLRHSEAQSQGLFRSTAKSQRMPPLPLHLTFSFDAVLIWFCDQF